MKIAIYPGTFDPVTRGHLEVIQRANCLWDQLIIAVASGQHKTPWIPLQQRVELIAANLQQQPRIDVKPMTGLLVDFAQQHQASVILRGIRSGTDVDYELCLARANQDLLPALETVFLPAKAAEAHIASSIVREVWHLGGDVSAWLPENVLAYLRDHR